MKMNPFRFLVGLYLLSSFLFVVSMFSTTGKLATSPFVLLYAMWSWAYVNPLWTGINFVLGAFILVALMGDDF